MNLIIKNKVIDKDINLILDKIVRDTHKPLFKQRIDNGENLTVTCPCHKNGQENKASCNILKTNKIDSLEYGLVHCFTCGYKSTLPQLVGYCFDRDEEFGKEWLYDNFSGDYIEDLLPEIDLNIKKENKYLDESILEKYNFYHPYMWERKLTKEVVDKFKVGYDKETNSITFPVWDEKNRLIMITKRSVDKKQFYIEKSKTKPVYLLNYLIKNHITTAYIAESQINALTLQGWGYPGVAMFGGGSKDQYEILKRSGIRNYVLCFDGDQAGDVDIKNFIKNMNNDVLISVKVMPRDGRDINDMTKEEFDSLKELYV